MKREETGPPVTLPDERVLVVSPQTDRRSELNLTIERHFPISTVLEAESVAAAQELLFFEEVQLIIVDEDDSDSLRHFIRMMRLEDPEPVVALVSKPDINDDLAEEIASSMFQVVIESNSVTEMRTWAMLRALLRLRRRMLEQLELVARLTEANMILEDKNGRLEEFCATLAHDIRGPLASMCMRLDLTLERYSDDLSEKLRDFLATALRSGERLSDMVQAMYEYALLGTGHKGSLQQVGLNELVDEVMDEVRLSRETEVQLVREELPQVWGNPNSLRRLFANLINNSVKYNDQSRPFARVAAGNEVNRHLGQFIQIVVEDNGVGMEESDLTRLFQFGKRGTGDKERDGLGVGLAVVQRVVDQHYGSVNVSSEPGKGTKFIVTLPTTDKPFQ